MALHMNIIFQVVLPEKWSKQYLELQLLQAPNQSPLMYRLVSEEALKLSINFKSSRCDPSIANSELLLG